MGMHGKANQTGRPKVKEVNKIKMPYCGYVCNEVELKYPKKQIRKRLSYQFWKPIIQEMDNIPYFKRVCIASRVWSEMDDRKNFGTMKQACFDLESLALCLIESNNNHE